MHDEFRFGFVTAAMAMGAKWQSIRWKGGGGGGDDDDTKMTSMVEATATSS